MSARRNIMAIFFAFVMVTSIVGAPLTAASSTGAQNQGGFESTSTSNSNSSPAPVESTSPTNAGAPEVPAELAGLDVQIGTIDKDFSGTPRDGDAWANVPVIIQGNTDGAYYPYRHTTDVELTVTDSDGEVVVSDSRDFRLQPSLDENYSGVVTFQVRVPQDGEEEYTFDANARTKGGISTNHPSGSASETDTIEGTSTTARAESNITVRTGEVFRPLPDVSFVQSYKSTTTESEVGHMEDLSLPEGEIIGGDVENFSAATSEGATSEANDYATFSSQSGVMSIVTGTSTIERNEPQTVVVRYVNTGSSDINLDIIDSSGEPIDDDTEYTLTRDNPSGTDAEEYTLYEDENGDEADSYIAVIQLSESEQEFVNEFGELFVDYNSDDSAELQVYCQSVISGSIGFSTSSCGLDGSDDTFATGVIEEMRVEQASDGDDYVTHEDDERLFKSAGEYVDITVDVENTGNTELTEDVNLFSNFEGGSVTTTENERFQEGTDYESDASGYYDTTVTAEFDEEHHSSNVDFAIRGESHAGEIEVAINGQARVIDNLTNQRTINLEEHFGIDETSDTFEIELTTRDGIFSGQEPQVDEFQIIADDPAANSDDNQTVSNLPPGETDTVTFEDIYVGEDSRIITYRALFDGDIKEVQVEVESDSERDEIQADAGGDYEVELPYTGMIQEQVGTRVIESAEDPGARWTQITDEPIDTGTTSRVHTVTLDRAPEYSGDIGESMDYWEEAGYMTDLDEYFPDEEDPSDWDAVDVTYTEIVETQTAAETTSGMITRYGADYESEGWAIVGESGESISDWETEWVTAQRTSSDGEISMDGDNYGVSADTEEWQPVTEDSPPSVWNDYSYWQEGNYIVDWNEVVTDSITAEYPGTCEQPPTSPDDECEDANEEGVTWERSDEPVSVEESQSEDTVTQQCSAFPPDDEDGKYDWTRAGVCEESWNPLEPTVWLWESPTPETTTYYRWDRVEEAPEFLFARPEYETQYQYERNLYETEITFEKEETGDIHQYEGPRYSYTPQFGSVDLQLDGSNSQPADGEEIVEYDWDFGDDGATPTMRISSLTNRSVSLTVTDSAGNTDTDTASINVSPGCTDFTEDCSWSHGFTDLDINAPEMVDYRYGIAQIGIETSTNGINQNWELTITTSEADTIRMGTNQEDCPTEYYQGTSIDAPQEVDSSELESDTTYCFLDDESFDGPDYFIHPKYDDDTEPEDVSFTAYDSEAEKTIWSGSQASYNETFATIINPRFNNYITRGEQEFTVTATPTQSSIGEIEETFTIELCEAGTAWECPDLDSDYDGTIDGADDCPYDPLFTSYPCEYIPEFDEGEGYIEFGDMQNQDGWNLASHSGSIELNRQQPTGGTPEYQPEASLNELQFSDQSLQFGYATGDSGAAVTNMRHDDLIAYYPMNERTVRNTDGAWESTGANWTLYDYSDNRNHANIWMYEEDDSWFGSADAFRYTDDYWEALPRRNQQAPSGTGFKFEGGSWVELFNYNHSHDDDANFQNIREDIQSATDHGNYTVSYWVKPDVNYTNSTGIYWEYETDTGDVIGLHDARWRQDRDTYTSVRRTDTDYFDAYDISGLSSRQFIYGLYFSDYSSNEEQLYHGGYFIHYPEGDSNHPVDFDIEDPDEFGMSHWAGDPYIHYSAHSLSCDGGAGTYEDCPPIGDQHNTQGGYASYGYWDTNSEGELEAYYTDPEPEGTQWSHYFHTQDGDSMSHWVDGEYIRTNERMRLSWHTEPEDAGMEMFIGAGWRDANTRSVQFEMFEGTISDLRIYDTSFGENYAGGALSSNSYLAQTSMLKEGHATTVGQVLVNDGEGALDDVEEATFDPEDIHLRHNIQFSGADARGYVDIELIPLDDNYNAIDDSVTRTYRVQSSGRTTMVNDDLDQIGDDIHGFRAEIKMERHDPMLDISVNHIQVYNHDPDAPEGEIQFEGGSIEQNADEDSDGEFTQSRFEEGDTLTVNTEYLSTFNERKTPIEITYYVEETGEDIVTTEAGVIESQYYLRLEEHDYRDMTELTRSDLIDAGAEPNDDSVYTIGVRIEEHEYYDEQQIVFDDFLVPE